MNLDDARAIVRDQELIRRDPFAAAGALAWVVSVPEASADVHDVVLHALEHREAFGVATSIVDAAVRELGLFPYLNPAELTISDRIAYEYHKPKGLGSVVFHSAQARVYRDLVRGENVVLSAPTSFGKSLLIDAMVASGKYKQIVIVVPTLALIDETRRRLATFADKYRIITHSMQGNAEKAIYVLTQERVVDRDFEFGVDFFVIDEFYKLSPGHDEGQRAVLLNHAFYKLKKLGAQFLLIGPAIKEVPASSDRVSFKFVHETYTTVASELHRVIVKDDELAELKQLIGKIEGPTIVFCSSPKRAADVSRALASDEAPRLTSSLRNASDWLSRNYHPEWHFAKALSHRIGVHHGRIPRALGQYAVRAFNADRLPVLVCTSTLIEGVNTKARNVVILDDTINKDRFDFFTFNNIRGRSGRMLKHFVGHVYLFHPEPQPSLPVIDFPAFTQSEAASESLLLQLDSLDLTDRSKARLEKYRDQNILPIEILRANVGVDPEEQIAFALDVAEHSTDYYPLLSWRGEPNWDQLVFASECMWKHFDAQRLGAGSVRTARQLATRIRGLRRRPATSELIQQQLQYDHDPDTAVRSVLDFLRLWANFHFPRLLRAMERIQQHEYQKKNLRPGNYSHYAASVENRFLDPIVLALEEYGIPAEVGRKLMSLLPARITLDRALELTGALDPERVTQDAFERELLADAQRTM